MNSTFPNDVAYKARATEQKPSAAKEIAGQSPQTRAIIDRWQVQDPQRSDRFIRIMYETPDDREPARMYRERLTKIRLDI